MLGTLERPWLSITVNLETDLIGVVLVVSGRSAHRQDRQVQSGDKHSN